MSSMTETGLARGDEIEVVEDDVAEVVEALREEGTRDVREIPARPITFGSTVAERVRARRQYLQLRIADVAPRLGITPAGYGHLERGFRPLTTDYLAKLARILDVPVGYFLPDVSEGGYPEPFENHHEDQQNGIRNGDGDGRNGRSGRDGHAKKDGKDGKAGVSSRGRYTIIHNGRGEMVTLSPTEARLINDLLEMLMLAREARKGR